LQLGTFMISVVPPKKSFEGNVDGTVPPMPKIKEQYFENLWNLISDPSYFDWLTDVKNLIFWNKIWLGKEIL